jgi:PAS domain-containing protein
MPASSSNPIHITIGDSKVDLNRSLQRLEDVIDHLDFIDGTKSQSQDYMVNFVQNLPFPCWIKAVDGTMMFISPAYQKLYDVRIRDYVGKRDVDVWGEEVADQFRENDTKVIDGNTIEYTVELVPNRVNPQADASHAILAKFPIYEGPNIIAVGGIIIAIFPLAG